MTVVQAHRFLRKLKNTESASALGTLAYLEPSSQYFHWHKSHLFLCGCTAHRGESLPSCLWGILHSLQHLITTKNWSSVGTPRIRVAFKSLVQLMYNQNLHVWSSGQHFVHPHFSHYLLLGCMWCAFPQLSSMENCPGLDQAAGAEDDRQFAGEAFLCSEKCLLMYLALPLGFCASHNALHFSCA